jgi:hypothetical protein
MKTLILLPVYSIILMGGWIVLSGGLTEARGIGHTNVTLHFVVLDAVTSSPIPAAVVSLYEADRPWTITEQTETSTLGKAEITRQFAFYFNGGSLLHRGTSLVNFGDRNVEVSAHGYKPSRCWLPKYTGRRYDLELSPPEPFAVVRLERLNAPSIGSSQTPERQAELD